MAIIPLDLGYGWTKGKNGSKLFREPSILGDSKNLHDENKKAGYKTFNGYFVGELARKHSDIKYYSMKDNKANTWTTEVLMQTALTYLQAGDIDLVTGLPVDYYFQQRGDFEQMIERVNGSKGELDVIGEGKYTSTIRINRHKIVPQPMGAVMDYLLNDRGELVRKEEARGRILVIDWGRYTLDLLVLEGMEVHKASCSPADMGIETAYKFLRRHLREHIGKSPASYDMDNIMATGEYEGYDVRKLIESSFKSVIHQIQLEVEGLNMHFHTHILAGGQASMLDQHMHLGNKVVGDQLSNLNGYGKMGNRLWLET